MSEQSITLKGIRVNNLKNIDLTIKLNKLIVITGVSGSGKSSLAFDTLFAEGQRRYVESLSSYARQFLGRFKKPECDYILGIPPAVAIEQKVNTSNPRSTVGTSTEIYDYLKLLFARAGQTFSPISGIEVKRDTPDDIANYILQHNDAMVYIMTQTSKLYTPDTLATLINQGFSRIKYKDEFIRIEDAVASKFYPIEKDNVYLIIDRIKVNNEKDTIARITESIETALYEGDGYCTIEIDGKKRQFSNKFETDGIKFMIPSVNMFSFNSPIGACPKCNGFGKTTGIDENLVVPNKALSLYDDAVVCWRGDVSSSWKNEILQKAYKIDFPVHTPYYQLSNKEKDILWNGCAYFPGINQFFNKLHEQRYKIQNRVMIARFTGKTTCPLCKGSRLKVKASYVKVGGKSLPELVDMPINELQTFFEHIELNEQQQKIAERIMPDIKNRINYLMDVGLGYLTLNRPSFTLSGGESQRINLATSLGSSLVGSLYILDEPSIGLHSHDTKRLISVLKRLRDIGNTVIVVEHDEDIMRAADEIIDIGPLAGRNGGNVVFQGDIHQLENTDTLTAKYLTGRIEIPLPARRRTSTQQITLSGATENNLKNVTVNIPLGVITVVSGVSGSGKSTLIRSLFVPALQRSLDDYSSEFVGSYDKISGDIKALSGVELIDQNPIGKSSRSNPVTYIKAWDDIRKLFADQPYAQHQGFKASYFSFNVPGGRCDACLGDGVIKIDMQFMADVYMECEHCHGKRFKSDVLEVKYRDKNIYDVLEMTANQAVEFFSQSNNVTERNITSKIQKLIDVGLGYVKLGQPSSTLSGGESQRIKLAYHLSLEKEEPMMFVFDEPTTGLHFHDINKLLSSLNALIDRNHTVLIIEHNIDIIKCADHIIDMGPDAGVNGGNIVFAGTPEELVACPESITGIYLKEKLKNNIK